MAETAETRDQSVHESWVQSALRKAGQILGFVKLTRLYQKDKVRFKSRALRVGVTLVVLVPVIFGVAKLWASRVPATVGPVSYSLWTTRCVIQVRRDLPAFTTISRDDLKKASTRATPKSPIPLTEIDQIVGWITTEPLPRGTLLTVSNVRKLPHNWVLLMVPRPFGLAPRAGDQVALLGMGKGQADVPCTYEPAIAFGLHGEQLVLALPMEQAKKAAPYLLKDRRLLVLRRQ
jgi:SAF domain